MSIIIKTEPQIQKMRIAGQLAANVLDMIEKHIEPGVTTDSLDAICHEYITNIQKATPAPLNYHGFPKSICTSVNHVVCHGIPSDKVLKTGDIINVDITVIKDGFHGDTSKMFVVGDKTTIIAQRLIDITYKCMCESIKQVKPGKTLIDIAVPIQRIAHKNNFSVVEAFCGHGIGESFHEDPQVLHYVSKNKPESQTQNITLRPGMTFTIEPMINIGKKAIKVSNKDGWTATTRDRSLSAQWEHTILVTETGYEVLTLRENEII